MRPKGNQATEACKPSWAEKQHRGLGLKGEEGKSQEEKWSSHLVIRCLPCHGGMSFR